MWKLQKKVENVSGAADAMKYSGWLAGWLADINFVCATQCKRTCAQRISLISDDAFILHKLSISIHLRFTFFSSLEANIFNKIECVSNGMSISASALIFFSSSRHVNSRFRWESVNCLFLVVSASVLAFYSSAYHGTQCLCFCAEWRWVLCHHHELWWYSNVVQMTSKQSLAQQVE